MGREGKGREGKGRKNSSQTQQLEIKTKRHRKPPSLFRGYFQNVKITRHRGVDDRKGSSTNHFSGIGGPSKIQLPSFFFFSQGTTYTLLHIKCNRLVSERSSLPYINIGVRIELTFFKFLFIKKKYFYACFLVS